jgi:hypothetical protein
MPSTPADAHFADLMSDAERWMAGFEGTPFLERNRAAFEKALRARAQAVADSRAAAEARLAHGKRIERSSAFLPEPSAGSPNAGYVRGLLVEL